MRIFDQGSHASTGDGKDDLRALLDDQTWGKFGAGRRTELSLEGHQRASRLYPAELHGSGHAKEMTTDDPKAPPIRPLLLELQGGLQAVFPDSSGDIEKPGLRIIARPINVRHQSGKQIEVREDSPGALEAGTNDHRVADLIPWHLQPGLGKYLALFQHRLPARGRYFKRRGIQHAHHRQDGRPAEDQCTKRSRHAHASGVYWTMAFQLK